MYCPITYKFLGNTLPLPYNRNNTKISLNHLIIFLIS